ncbi:MAG: tyrosine-type recombinase/integrase [Firmicutes bacterium]|nr:tyrosine-type recombinase/integrase [Bacillota bacterium]
MGIRFTGPFAPMCEQFVAQKRAFGSDYTQQEKLLHMFDNFSKAYPVDSFVISEALALAWCQKRPNEADLTRYNRIMEMQRFARFLIDQGYPSYLINFCPAKNSTHTPYIFTKDEIHRIFEVVDSLEPCASVPSRHLVMPILLRLLYGCGLRISEALALRIADVDLENGVLHIRHGKNGRERLVPMSPSLIKRCAAYAQIVLAEKGSDAYFLFRMANQPYSRSGIGKAFRGFLWDAGIPYLGKDRGPSVHDLRHTFVCHRLNQWAADGADLNAVLPVLSKYLGHTSVSATGWYLRLTAEAYPDVIQAMEHFSADVFPNVWEVNNVE